MYKEIILKAFEKGKKEIPGKTTKTQIADHISVSLLNDYKIQITATVVRIPVIGGHCESVNIETHKSFQMNEIIESLENSSGVKIQDNPAKFDYPMPITAHHKNDVFVGRIREDFTRPNTFNMWIVADNLRKGAATNAVQIAEYLMSRRLI